MDVDRVRPRAVDAFFFQAEDGIRAHCVTGVQTCALPILVAVTASGRAHVVATLPHPLSDAGRSEERRVGKECRSRWSPCDEKKNVSRPLDALSCLLEVRRRLHAPLLPLLSGVVEDTHGRR